MNSATAINIGLLIFIVALVIFGAATAAEESLAQDAIARIVADAESGKLEGVE